MPVLCHLVVDLGPFSLELLLPYQNRWCLESSAWALLAIVQWKSMSDYKTALKIPTGTWTLNAAELAASSLHPACFRSWCAWGSEPKILCADEQRLPVC